jgi:hypothetical protein
MRTSTSRWCQRLCFALTVAINVFSTTAYASIVPVIDLSGVWIATVESEKFLKQVSPGSLFTLSLQRDSATVTPNGAGVQLFYTAKLVIDAYTVRNSVPNDFNSPVVFESCSRAYVDNIEERRTATTTSPTFDIIDGFDSPYHVGLFFAGAPSNPKPGVNFSLQGGPGTPVDLVVTGRRLELVGRSSLHPGALSVQCRRAETSSGTGFVALSFRRVASGNGSSALGSIAGNVRSRAQTETETENEVQRLTVQLLRQPNGGVRAQSGGETTSDYLDFLTSNGSVLVRELTVEPDSEGSYPFGSPGAFRFDNVELLQKAAGGGFRASHYTALVTRAQTDEYVFDDLGNIIPGETSELTFGRGFATNRIPDGPDAVIEVEALDSIPAKQTLVDRLSATCNVNYRSAEQPLVAYLEQLRNGSVVLTDERNEGLRRAVWAERAVLGGVVLADQLYDRALGGMGTVIADAFDDLTDFASAKLSAARKRADRIQAAGPPPPEFNPPSVSPGIAKRLTASDTLVFNSDKAGITASALKAVKPLIVLGLTKAGMDASKTESIADGVYLVGLSGLSAVKSGRLGGAAKPLIKKAIESAIAASKPVFLDSSDTVAFSYCQLTRGELDFSAAQTQTWAAFGDDLYRADRGRSIAAMTRMGNSASAALVQADFLLGAGSGLDAAQDGLAVLGTVAKQAKVVEKVTQAAKYLTNLQGVVAALVEIYANLPVGVNESVRLAFGQQPTLLTSGPGVVAPPARAVSSARATAVVPDLGAYYNALDALTAALEDDDMTAAIEAGAGDDPTALPAARKAYSLTMQALLLRALAAPPSQSNFGFDIQFAKNEELRLDLLVSESELWDLLSDLFVGVLAGDYSGLDDHAYVLAKNRALSKITSLRTQVGGASSALAILVQKLNAAEAGGAVFVTIDAPVSIVTGGDTVTASPESFTVSAKVRNLSAAAIGALTARLEIVSPEASTAVTSSAVVAIGDGTLNADDSGDNGDDEATVTWTIEYSGDFSGEVIALSVEILESGTEPASFVTNAAETFLLLDPAAADADLDGIPDSYEAAFGLATDRDDSAEDADEDDVSNGDEFRIGTEPDNDDTDDDGLEDGEELIAGVDGEITNPLEADSDGDGTNDLSDGAPNDASTTDAPAPSGEPVVAVNQTQVVLGAGRTFAEISITNAGAGALLWSVGSDREDIVSTIPTAGTSNGPGSLLVSVAPGYIFPSGNLETVTLTFRDEAGTQRDTAAVQVVLGAVFGGAVCGDANESGNSSPADITASDALLALRSAVGLVVCERCRCDVDASGVVTATDALNLLRYAVGIAVTLVCPPCS